LNEVDSQTKSLIIKGYLDGKSLHLIAKECNIVIDDIEKIISDWEDGIGAIHNDLQSVMDDEVAKRGHDDGNNVSYTVLRIDRLTESDILNRLSVAINVRTNLTEGIDFPFTGFSKFEIIKESDKLFLYGVSGAGKSRSIFEFFKENLLQYKQIIVINPRTSTIGELRTARLSDLVEMISAEDAVIWDNFPDGLRKKDQEKLFEVLELLGSLHSKKLIVALKPKYLEALKNMVNKIPEFYPVAIEYSPNELKKLLISYGKVQDQFASAFHTHVSPYIDRLTKILWQREPTPLTVLDFYNEISKIVVDDAIATKKSLGQIVNNDDEKQGFTATSNLKTDVSLLLAQQLPRSGLYYTHQFNLLSHIKERHSEVELLFIIKLCYDLEIERTINNIDLLQNEVFKSTFMDKTDLRNWIYSTGNNFSMHDVCRESITFTDDIKVKIVSYLINHFSQLIHLNILQIEALGLFLGRHIMHFPKDEKGRVIPQPLLDFMNSKVSFERSFGRGVGEVFEFLNEDLQKIITSMIDTEIHFASGIGESLGARFSSLERESPIFKKIEDDFLFARYFGNSLGKLFPLLNDSLRKQITESANTNPQLSDGLGAGLGYTFESLDKELQLSVFTDAESNSEMMRGLGYGFGLRFSSLSELDQRKIFQIGDKYSEFDFGLGYSLGEVFRGSTKIIQDMILDRINTNPLFSFGVGLFIVFANPSEFPDKILERIDSNGGLAFGLGLGFGISFDYLTKEYQDLIRSKARKNIRLSIGLAEGIGLVFNQIDENKRNGYLRRIKSQESFAEGLAIGLGNTWIYNKSDLQFYSRKISYNNNQFAYGLGFGIGHRLWYMNNTLRSEMLLWADTSNEFDRGLGLGLGMVFPYLGMMKDQVLKRANTNTFFGTGLGTGLGWIYHYLSNKDYELFNIISFNNRSLGKGYGYGIGLYTFNHFDNNFLSILIKDFIDNFAFVEGLGEGIGLSWNFHQKLGRRSMVMDLMNTNPSFALGFGSGLGRSFNFQPKKTQDNIFETSLTNPAFATGLGEGIARIYTYVGEKLSKRIKLVFEENSNYDFILGMGIGFGRYLPSLEFQSSSPIKKFMENQSFAKGFNNWHLYYSNP
jgi:hypothetical protein